LRRLTDDEVPRARAAMARVLRTLHLPSGPFAPDVEGRMLLALGNGSNLDARQLEAIARAARAQGWDTRAYLAEFFWNWAAEPQPDAWYEIDLAAPAGYDDPSAWSTGPHEHALCGLDGEWAVLTTEDLDGVLGGPAAFVDAVRADLAVDDERLVRAFLDAWASETGRGAPSDWQGDLVRHLYGRRRGDAWLAGTPFA
jgi:hypothetical protein